MTEISRLLLVARQQLDALQSAVAQEARRETQGSDASFAAQDCRRAVARCSSSLDEAGVSLRLWLAQRGGA